METKNILIGGGVILAAFYLMNKNKKPATQEATEELPSGVGGGGGFMPVEPITPKPTPKPAPAPAPAPPVPIITEKGSGGSIVRCPSGYVYNGRACVKAAPVAQSTSSGRTATSAAIAAGSGLTAAPPVMSAGTVGGAVQGTTYTTSSRSPVGQVGGNVMVGFSGKKTLTLDNLLC